MLNISKIRSRYSYIAIVLLLLLAIASLVWVYQLRLTEFHSYHHNFATGASGEVSNQFAFLLNERQRLVTLFAEDNQPLLEQLVHDPENTGLHDRLGRRLLRSFPDYFAYVLATPQGEPYWIDFDGYVGDVCAQDIQKFAHTNINRARIHPNPIEYHYDVMARWSTKKNLERILMVSFKPDQLVQTLRTVKVPGHSLILLQTDNPNLIELTDQGSRTTLKRDDFHLTEDELSRIVHRQDIPDSRWQLVDMFEAGFVDKYRRELLTDMALFLVAFLGVAITSILLIRREEQARQRAETAREEMIATVTHELRTPLTSIVGSLGLLVNGVLGTLPEKARELLDIMNRNADGLRRLIDDLLDSSRIEAGNLRLDFQTVDLVSQVNDALARIAPYAKGMNVQLALSTELDSIPVSADPVRLQQIMANLLSNAAKFTPAETVVTINIAKRDLKRVRVSVIDQGPGISDEFRSRIFQRYSQDHANKNQKMTSSGLGLSIARALVELHGGTIGFESKKGEGTTFYFDLPVNNNSANDV